MRNFSTLSCLNFLSDLMMPDVRWACSYTPSAFPIPLRVATGNAG